MQTVWVPRRNKDMPDHPSQKLQNKLASVDRIYTTLHRFWTRWMLGSVLPEKTCKGGVAPEAVVTLSGRSQSRSHSPKPGLTYSATRHQARLARFGRPQGHQFQSPAIRRSAGPITIRT